MNEFNQGDKVRVKKINSPQRVIGQHGNASGVTVRLNGEQKFLKSGTLFKVSSYTNENIVSLDSSPVPLVQKDFINRNEGFNRLFELVEAAE